MIPEANDWVFFKEIDFSDEDINQFNIDTRDFHVGYTVDSGIEKLNLSVINQYPHFFHSSEEVKELLDRLFSQSGGGVEWRYLSLSGIAERYTAGWQLKYIRIIRSPNGWIVCNNDYSALNKEMLACDINQKLLNAH